MQTLIKFFPYFMQIKIIKRCQPQFPVFIQSSKALIIITVPQPHLFPHPPISSSSVPLNFLPSDCQADNLVSLSRLYPFFLLSSMAFCVTRSRISLCYAYRQLFSLFLFIILCINDRFSLAIVELSWQFYSTFICRIKTANII